MEISEAEERRVNPETVVRPEPGTAAGKASPNPEKEDNDETYFLTNYIVFHLAQSSNTLLNL